MERTPERMAYSVKEVALALGVSEWAVREEIRRGGIESVRVGRRVLVPRPALERLVGISGPAAETADPAYSTDE